MPLFLLLVRMTYPRSILAKLIIPINAFRLAEGHAKLMYRTKVEIVDAVTAAELMGTTLINNADIGCPFPIDPTETYHSKGTYMSNDLRNCVCMRVQMYKISTEILYNINVSIFFYSQRLV